MFDKGLVILLGSVEPSLAGNKPDPLFVGNCIGQAPSPSLELFLRLDEMQPSITMVLNLLSTYFQKIDRTIDSESRGPAVPTEFFEKMKCCYGNKL